MYMAKKKGGVSKSQAIRDLLEQNPRAKSKDIMVELAGKGIKVSQNLVYLIKSKSKARKRKAKRQQAIAAGRAAGNGNAVELVVDVKRLAHKAGGMKRLKQLVDILSE
jgi:hypothetical protein